MKAKDFLLKFAIAICFALTASNTFAYDFEVGGIYYNVTSLENLEVEVTSYCDYQDDEYDEHKYSGDIVIPETVTYKNRILSVTSIESGAFRDCSGLTSIDIPNSVTTIGYAFYGCSRLTSIDIPDGVTEIGNYAFYGCSRLTSIDIPDGVTEIGNYAFSDCYSLTSVKIGNGVTTIGEYAFNCCSALTSVDIPNSVTTIGDHAFSGCSALTSIDIPDGITSIENGAFRLCSGLTSVKIGKGVKSIRSDAFALSGLTSIDIPDGVTSIDDDAFLGCSRLTSVKIANSVTSIGTNAFYECDTIEEFVFPAGVTAYPHIEELYYPLRITNYYGLFGKMFEADSFQYRGTFVKKLHFSDSPTELKINKMFPTYEIENIKLKEVYIGRMLDDCFFPPDLEKAEIGGCLKSDIEGYVYGATNIKTIIYGDSIAEIIAPVTSASEIYLRSTTPPVTEEWENSNYLNSILYVPQGTLAVYQNADVWKNFWDIREWDATTDVKSPTIDNADAVDVSIDGKQVSVTTNNPGTRVQIYNTEGVLVYDGKEGTVNIGTPGLYIIKAGNHTKKLLIK